MKLTLESLDATAALAAVVAHNIKPPYPAILLRGHLGAGKTTFIRALVSNLPGAEQAEVSSPSFNLLNLYPCSPPVAHFDLYRTSGFGIGDDLEEILNSPDYLHLIEWSEYLPQALCPAEYIEMNWSTADETRCVTVNAHGVAAQHLAQAVAAHFS